VVRKVLAKIVRIFARAITDMSRLLDQGREATRRLHYSIRTEDAYVLWVKRFVLFHGKRHRRAGGQRLRPGPSERSPYASAGTWCRRLCRDTSIDQLGEVWAANLCVLAVRNSMKRSAARSPASAMTAGTIMPPVDAGVQGSGSDFVFG
jgi:hypothetical protein